MSTTKKERKQAEDDLQTIKDLFPGTEVTLKCGEVFKVTPTPITRVPELLDSVATLVDTLIDKDLQDEVLKKDEEEVNKENFVSKLLDDLPKLLRTVGAQVFDILVIALNQPIEWFERVTISDSIKLLEAILYENDFEEIIKNGESLVETVKKIFMTSESEK